MRCRIGTPAPSGPRSVGTQAQGPAKGVAASLRQWILTSTKRLGVAAIEQVAVPIVQPNADEKATRPAGQRHPDLLSEVSSSASGRKTRAWRAGMKRGGIRCPVATLRCCPQGGRRTHCHLLVSTSAASRCVSLYAHKRLECRQVLGRAGSLRVRPDQVCRNNERPSE